MINVKHNKGITIITLVLTIIIALILTGTVIRSINSSTGTDHYNSMKSDITLIEDKILLYYNRYNEIPKTNREINISGETYYEIDLEKLDDMTLNYGAEYKSEGNLTTSSDIYVVNDKLNVYYVQGVKMDNKIYHE